MIPDWNIIKHFQDLPLRARALVFLAVNALVAVLAAPLIGSVGIQPYLIFIVAVTIISFVLLFVSPNQVEKESMRKIKERMNIASSTSTRKPQEQDVEVQQKKRREEFLHKLTREEKEFLAPYVFQDRTSQYTNVMGGIYQSLFKKQIVDPPASVGYMTYRDVLIQEWAKDYLIAHPELLKGFENAQPRTKPHWH